MPEGQERKRRSLIPGFVFPPHRESPKQYSPVNNRPRWVLHIQAVVWRFLMSLGMFFHRLAPPRPPKPNFHRIINTTISGQDGRIILYFYVPADYETQKRLWRDQAEDFGEESGVEGQSQDRSRVRMSISSIGDGLRRRSRSMRKWGDYPCVVNFHGGGFTLGSPLDDARWCGTVVQECNAVVVSVDYRLAPEHPFPTAVEDGVDAVLWLHKHAEELGINTNKIALSGFSSGGNMAFTVPLRLYDQQTGFARNESDLHLPLLDGARTADSYALGTVSVRDPPPGSSASNFTASTGSTAVPPESSGGHVQWIDPDGPPPEPGRLPKAETTVLERTISIPEVQIKCVVSWYPSLDYTRTREERRATCVRADQELPALFTNLFDDSYLHPPKAVSLDSPYLSPGVAPTSLLRNALPEEIILHTCEWDMLLDEGQDFHRRLTSEEVDKKVTYTMVPEVPHGWDKAPNPWKPTPGVREYYVKACKELKRVFGERIESEEMPPRKGLVR